MKGIIAFAIGLMSMISGGSVYAQSLTSHDIIQRIANETCVVRPAPLSLQWQVPQGWTVEAKETSVSYFKVPYHVGVGGFVQVFTVPTSLDDVMLEITNRTKITFTLSHEEIWENESLKGDKRVYAGRFGGEVWDFMVVFATRASGEQVTFFAQAPEGWFSVYALLFDDILKSLK